MPTADDLAVIVAGRIKIFVSKRWKHRFCVIAKASQLSATVKLFVYKEASDYKKSVDLSAQQTYDTVFGLDSVSYLDKTPVRTTIVLTCSDRLVLLGFNCYSDLVFWLGKIGDNVQDASYRARFVKCESVGKRTQQQSPTAASDSGCGPVSGLGRLHVQPSRLCFYTEPAEACKTLAVWPLEFVKRYMVNESMACFVFEGDIGCGRFRGMHYFQCERRYEAYADMKAACVNKPMPSLSHQSSGGALPSVEEGAAAAAAPAPVPADPRRPSSDCIDIPLPRGGGQQKPREQQPQEQQRRGRHHHSHCCTRQHRLQQQQQQQPPRQTTADSGYDGAGSRAQSVMAECASAVAAGPFRFSHAESASASHVGREYCNLTPDNFLPQSPPPMLPMSTSDQQVAGLDSTDCSATGPLVGFSRSLSITAQQLHYQKRWNATRGHCRCRRARSSVDLRCDSVVEGGDGGTDDDDGKGAAAASGECERDDSEADDDGASCCCSRSGCCCCSSGGCSCESWQQQQPVGPADSSPLEVRTRKPRHGFEYASRAASSYTGACYVNLQHQHQPMSPLEDPRVQQQMQPRRRSNDESAALSYALLDHRHHSFDGSAAGQEQLQQQQHQLNYTEVDHSKTAAFREIAAELGGVRRPATPGWSASASAPAASPPSGGGSSGRRSFIRIFHRGISFHHD